MAVRVEFLSWPHLVERGWLSAFDRRVVEPES